MRGLALEHLVADLALGILDQQPALCALHEYDERDHHHRHHDDGEDDAGRKRALGRESSNMPNRGEGSPATMPARMISEMPLPIPRAVFCPPSHIKNIVPPVNVIVVEIRKNMPGSATAFPAPSSPIEMP